MPTDISEKGLETLILRHMTGTDGLAPVAEGLIAETPVALEPTPDTEESIEPEEPEAAETE